MPSELAAIAAPSGIDAIYVGPWDLGLSLEQYIRFVPPVVKPIYLGEYTQPTLAPPNLPTTGAPASLMSQLTRLCSTRTPAQSVMSHDRSETQKPARPAHGSIVDVGRTLAPAPRIASQVRFHCLLSVSWVVSTVKGCGDSGDWRERCFRNTAVMSYRM
jgi:hypothetical protein